MAGRVEDKVCLVTGAASGIGRACAERLAAEGARGGLADVAEAPGGEAAMAIGGDALFLRHDVAEEASWQDALGAVLQRFDRLDVLVNNAGILIPGDVESASVEQWDRMQAVNARGVFLGCKHAIPAMRRGGGGSIVNLSSTAGITAVPPYAAYGASKGAVRALSKTVAIHCLQKGDAIRCNSVHPGGVDTPLVRALYAGSGMSAEQVEATLASREGPAFGAPRDVADLVLYLASDESRFVTGAELVIDGGLTAE